MVVVVECLIISAVDGDQVSPPEARVTLTGIGRNANDTNEANTTRSTMIVTAFLTFKTPQTVTWHVLRLAASTQRVLNYRQPFVRSVDELIEEAGRRRRNRKRRILSEPSLPFVFFNSPT